ncbi:unnamed protein product [Aureobasidium mustum]|uniref:Uncharacterized protein n=1 Tax=Aureobasidium mustum TaxID=2773714 RepID=A0A9N8JQ13_9PEZI|nr:unnamed protein product [Aureobasidium mustum]
MKCDCLARRAILFVTFIIATTVLYGFTTKFLFTAPNYDDVSIDPEGGSYYDYGSKVAAAVWKGAGQWIGMSEPSPDNTTIFPGEVSKDVIVSSQEQQLQPTSTPIDELDPEQTLMTTTNQEKTSRRQRLRLHRVNSQSYRSRP